jgi:hypothetical protein
MQLRVFVANDDRAEASSNSGRLLERREASLMLVLSRQRKIAAAWLIVGTGRPSERAGGQLPCPQRGWIDRQDPLPETSPGLVRGSMS